MSTIPTHNNITSEEAFQPWKGWQIFLFRIAFIFFIVMSIPWDFRWYKSLFAINWFSVHYRDIYDIARFSPSWGLAPKGILYGYGEWIAFFLVATLGAIVWSVFDRKRKEYNILYYWLRVIVRYRAGIGIIGFGFTKLLPVQMPYPSLGLLNTDFGDFTAQKIYWLSIGIVPWYQIFAGIVEVAAGALLFFRRTTTLGAVLLFGALGSIVFVNFSYDGGVHVYSSYFVLYAAFLIIYDIPKLYNLLILEKFTVPVHYYPSFSQKWLQYTRIGLKSLSIFIFLVLLAYVQLLNFLYDPYKQPAMAGLKQLRGNYDVAEFKINNETILYSPLDTVRWQQATFENWTTLTFKVNKPIVLDLSNGGGSPMRDINRTFELTGTGGGQRVFYYEADTVNHVLHLQDKNTASARSDRRNRGKSKKSTINKKDPNFLTVEQEYNGINKIALTTRRFKGIKEERAKDVKRKRMTLHYETTDGNKVILRGVNETNDSIYVVLNRVQRNYELSKSSLSAGAYN
ncbi:hypothetical protein Pedsa_2000 [Pseudopedobacter saltans DSM 12145]|uniref:DoxX family protein n=1 Tax=Pseudopedobacter saltans (strain ATCC 51119 / DSM 12145 / JCM 21818 / CCUG 39354 / LMG 10337 / NBRC 100064 / NCIMB 13643) TaxID=762903 RepID=F0S9Z5_PSESL|nr:hypothetical protein [Pseudopedobacter saltans]ADY52553.1 hypothetical protein Pedsa_2000 [Pseudopedobacter saltans DSM 12145]